MNKSIYPAYNITTVKSRVEASPTFAGLTAILASTASAGGNVDAGDHTSNDWMRNAAGSTVALKDVTSTRTIGTALANGNNDWKDITFSIS